MVVIRKVRRCDGPVLSLAPQTLIRSLQQYLLWDLVKDKTNPVGYAAHWSKRNKIRRVFCYLPIVGGAPVVLGYSNVLLVV